MRRILPILVLLFLPVLLKAQTVTINQPFNDTLICLGSNTFKLPYTVTGSFGSGNVFTAHLSNASGSFSSAVNIGTDTSTISDTILCIVPANTTAGNGYRIRIVASNPVVTSVDNGMNIRISPSPEFAVDTTLYACSGRDLRLNIISLDTFTSYFWSGPMGFSSTLQYPTLVNPSALMQGEYTVSVAKAGCVTVKTFYLPVRSAWLTPTVSSNSPVCLGDTLHILAKAPFGAGDFALITPDGSVLMGYQHSIIPTLADSGIYGVYGWLGASCHSDTVYHRVEINSSFVPQAVIWPTPRSSVGPYTAITLHSLIINGLKPKYQWYLNGNAIVGATDSTYTIRNFVSGDRIHLVVSSDTTCTRTVSSDTVRLNINMGTVDISTRNTLSIFPNPNTGQFSITFSENVNGPATIELFNTLGQCVIRKRLIVAGDTLKDLDVTSAPAGIYHLRISTDKEQFTSTFKKD